MPSRKLPPNDVIVDLYRSDMPSSVIAEKFAVSPITVIGLLRRLGEPRRTALEAAHLRTEQGRANPASYWLGKTQPPEMVEKQAVQIRGEKHYLWKGGVETEKKRNRKPAASLGRPSRGHFQKGTHWRERKPFWDKEWLLREYVEEQRSAADIGLQFEVKAESITFWLRKHAIPRRSIAEARSVKPWGASGEKNGMHGKKGKQSPSWKGGHTPERQTLYASPEWHALAKSIYERDCNRCQRCGRKANFRQKRNLHIHHIVSFSCIALRLEPTNLVLLCNQCHRWVHSRKNTEKFFIKEEAPCPF